jgi:imidazolonepropionase-like amidohydrolase
MTLLPIVLALLAPSQDPKPVLEKLGVVLKVTERPAAPKAPSSSVLLTLLPQGEESAKAVVSFGLPFPPETLSDDHLLRVLGADGQEIAAYTHPLAHWWIDGKKGAIRSALVQFQFASSDKTPQKATIVWDKPRTKSREKPTPLAETQTVRTDDGFDFHCPKVLVLLPPAWLCASRVAWQQVPASENMVAPWFDQHLVEQFPASTKNIATKSVEAHLYDRPATYAKIYVRHGEEKYLLAALKSNDFYLQNLGADGFFQLKKGDFKYVYSEGSAIMYLLTGDERYKEGVLRALKSWAQWKRIEYKGDGFWTERHAGTGLAAYLHAYELTGDPEHLAKARRFFEAVYSLQVTPLDGKEPDGAWLHTGDSHGDGNGWTTSPWMSALLMDSIWKLWMITGESRCLASMAMYAKFDLTYAVTPDRKGVFYMANSPGRGKSEEPESPPHNMEACYILSLGYWLSGGTDKAFLDTINTLWPPLLKDGANSPGRKFNWRFRETSMLVWFLKNAGQATSDRKSSLLREYNPPPAPAESPLRAIVGATLIDGRGGPPVRDAVVLIRGERLLRVGPRPEIPVPEGADVVDGRGLSVLPGFFDSHFHIERDYELPGIFLSHGVTSLRDPGQWIETFDPVRKATSPQPRCFVTGPHLDQAPPAHPKDALVVSSDDEVRQAVDRAVDQGASAIKVYFRLTLDRIRIACESARARGVPVTAHLELVNGDDAVRAGLTGVEHVTSFGTALADPAQADRYRASVDGDNEARRKGRFELWSTLDLEHNPRLQPLLDLVVERKTFLSVTLAVFEKRSGDKGATEAAVQGYLAMLDFVRRAHRAGATIVVGSHSSVPKAKRGWAYQRELELLVECGLTPLEAIRAGTLDNARFFRQEDRLGSLEPGKLADLVLVEGDPSLDLGALRQVRRVMLNGSWVPPLDESR